MREAHPPFQFSKTDHHCIYWKGFGERDHGDKDKSWTILGIYGQVLGRIRIDKDKSESKTGQETEIGQEWDRNWTNVGQKVDSGQELDKSESKTGQETEIGQ